MPEAVVNVISKAEALLRCIPEEVKRQRWRSGSTYGRGRWSVRADHGNRNFQICSIPEGAVNAVQVLAAALSGKISPRYQEAAQMQ